MVVDSAVSVVVGTVEASVVSVAEEVGEAVALADLVAGSVDSAAEGSGGRRIDQLKIRKAKSEIISNDQEGERRIRVKAGMKMRDSKLRSQLFERIEDLHARSAKVSVVAGDNGEVVPAGRSRNVAVFNRHAPARPLQLPLLFGPNVRDRSVEAENPSVQCSHQASQPGLQRLPLPSLFAAHPVGKLRQDHRAGVAVVLFSLEPSRHARVAAALCGLTQDIGVQQPAHNLDRKYSRRRGGRSSSMGTGQALSTFNQFGFDAMRRHIKASSSASKSMRKWSPGLAGTAAGTVNRRFESSVTIMVGYSHYRPTVATCTVERRTWRKTENKEWILQEETEITEMN